MSRLTDDGTITTDRLVLRRLQKADAEEMVQVLADPALHEFTGGQPATLEELIARYRSWEEGSGSPTELWLNWIVRRIDDEAAIGTVQATVVHRDEGPEAFVAWTIGTPWQRHGYASEATCALVKWLAEHGVESVVARINPDHVASATVATRAGLHATDEVLDGEIVWRRPLNPR
jgi:RimJ/RimL family protein N-acetyltransferase